MWGAKEHNRHVVWKGLMISNETMGTVEVVRKQLENWEEMRNGMLAERQERSKKKLEEIVIKREQREG